MAFTLEQVLTFGSSESTSGDMSADLTSNPVTVNQYQTFAVQVSFAGSSPTGTLTLEASNYLNGDYVTVTNSSQAISADGTHMWNVYGAAYWFIRVKFTRASGTGTMTGVLKAKGQVS